MTENTKQCPYCGGEIPVNAKKCKHCGEWLVIQEKDKPKASLHLAGWLEAIICIISAICYFNIGYSNGFVLGLFLIYVVLHLYFLPTLIADGKRTQYTYAIFALNLILGLTLIFWIVCLVWALSLPDLSKNIEKEEEQDEDEREDEENKKFFEHINAEVKRLTENRPKSEPQEILQDDIKRKFNWGAFWLSWIWGIANKSYLTLLTLIPFFNFIWMFVCGFKGNEWAWENKKWSSLEAFNNTQKKWAIVGNCIAVLSLVLTLVLFVVVQNVSNEPVSKEPTLEQEEVNPNTEERGDIIDMTEDVDNHITSKSEQPNSKLTQQSTPQKVQLQPVVQHTTKTTPTHLNTVVPQTKPVETQQNNQDIDDFMN